MNFVFKYWPISFPEKKGKDDEGKEGGRRRIGFGDDDDDVRFEKVQKSFLPTEQNNQGGHPWRQQLLTDIFKTTNVFKRWKSHSVNVEAQGKQ